jgi:hypothetical protein
MARAERLEAQKVKDSKESVGESGRDFIAEGFNLSGIGGLALSEFFVLGLKRF